MLWHWNISRGRPAQGWPGSMPRWPLALSPEGFGAVAMVTEVQLENAGHQTQNVTPK